MYDPTPLEARIKALEDKLDGAMKMWAAVGKVYSDLAEDFDKLEAALAKQRAVNEALLAWINIDRDGYEGPGLTSEALISALREAQK